MNQREYSPTPIYRPVSKVDDRPMTAHTDDYVVPASGKSKIVALFALLIGIPFWLEGARFTRDGGITAINWICERFGTPWRVPELSWQASIIAMTLVGLAYTYIELGRQPVRLPRNLRKDFLHFEKWRFERSWEVWAVWIILVVTDVGTTYIGARNPDPSGLSIIRDIAAASATLAAYAILITFIPDRMIRYGWRTLKG